MMKNLLAVLIGVIVSVTAFAQAPNAFKYQAIARDDNGNILSHTQVDIKISILSEATDGVAVYSEAQNVVTNSFGLINLDIGRGENRTGDIGTVNWGSSRYFLRIDAAFNGDNKFVHLGTSELLSVPYALYAGQIMDNTRVPDEWTNDGTNIYTDETSFPGANTGIGTTGPGGKLHIYGPGLTGPNAPMLMIEHGAGFSSTFRRSANNPGNALFLLQKSRGTIGAPAIVQNGDNIGQIRMEGYDGSAYQTAGWVRVAVDGIPTSGIVPGALLFATTDYSGTVAEKMRIDRNGLVGIGTTQPQYRLHVVGDAYIEEESQAFLELDDTGAPGNAGITFSSSGNYEGWVYHNAVDDILTLSNSWSGWDPHLVIANGGNVGINTTTPAYLLDVNGNVNSAEYYKNGFVFTEGKWTEIGFDIYYNSGRVAIGTTNPDNNGLNVHNYVYNRGAVRGADQNGDNVYAEGFLGVLNPYSIGLPVVPYNIGVLGIKPNLGSNGVAVYGWNNDDNTENYAGLFVSDGAGSTNYGVYAQATGGTTNNYAGQFYGRVNIQGSASDADYLSTVFYSEVNHSNNNDTYAIHGESVPSPGWGVGVLGTGGYKGVYGYANGTNYGGTSYGVYGYASGTAGTRIGVYGYASGGDANWAGYFSGDAYISSDLRIATTTQATGYALSVNGKIACEEVLVQDLASWPDYVFNSDYELMDLKELEKSIQANNHLPGVPSALHIEENGLHLGDMQRIVIEKIEELTLYTIQQEKRIEKLEKEINLLRSENKSLKNSSK